MAKKKAAKKQSPIKIEADFIQDAYGDALKNQVRVFIDGCVAKTAKPEKKFLAGLIAIRKARDQALKSVKSSTPIVKTDAELIQEAFGDALKNLVRVLGNGYAENAPNAEQEFAANLAIIRDARDQSLKLAQG